MTIKFSRTCWAAVLGGCSPDRSREHVVSEAVSKVFPVTKATIKGKAGIPMSQVKAHTLCRKHNSDLSPLDSEAGNFVAGIANFLATPREVLLLSNGTSSIRIQHVDGPRLERWMLKTFVNHAMWEGAISTKGPIWHSRGAQVVDAVFNGAALPDGDGLYLISKKKPIFPGNAAGAGFSADVITTETTIFRAKLRRTDSKHLTPLWYWFYLCKRELALRTNITRWSHFGWRSMLESMDADPKKYGTYHPVGFGYQPLLGAASMALQILIRWPQQVSASYS